MISGTSKLLARIFWVTGLAGLSRRLVSSKGRFAVEFHGTPRRAHPPRDVKTKPEILGEGLEQVLRWITARFRLLHPEEFLESDVRGALLTFDDGFASNYDVALPILERFQAPAVFFVTTRHLEGGPRRPRFVEKSMRSLWRSVENIPNDVARDHFDLMGRDEISACLKSGLITIGSHSASHQKLTELGERELDREIRSSKGVLEDVTGQEVDLFAYPFGAVDARVAKSVAAAGFRAAFAEGDSPTIALSMAIPRIGVYQSESWYLAAQFSGVRGRPITGRIVAI